MKRKTGEAKKVLSILATGIHARIWKHCPRKLHIFYRQYPRVGVASEVRAKRQIHKKEGARLVMPPLKAEKFFSSNAGTLVFLTVETVLPRNRRLGCNGRNDFLT